MLKQRIITAIWLIPLVMGAIFLLPASYFSWALVAVFLIAAKEWGRIIDSRCEVTQWSFTATLAIVLVAINLLVPADAVWSRGQLHPIMLAIILIGACWWLFSLVLVISYPRSAKLWQGSPMLKSMFGQLTLLPCFASLIALKALSSPADPYFGGILVFGDADGMGR